MKLVVLFVALIIVSTVSSDDVGDGSCASGYLCGDDPASKSACYIMMHISCFAYD